MDDCQCISGCPFFNNKMSNMPAMANILKKRYCQGDFNECARFTVFTALGKGKVPIDLYPNQMDVAITFINKNK